jgi:1,4-dihydroxy-2-naphthoate octaprenyltransferase
MATGDVPAVPTNHPVTQSWSRRELWTRKLLYPGHTFPTAASPILVAIGLAIHDRVFALVPAALAFLAGWLIQFAGVVTDNYENLVRQPDDREHPEMVDAVGTGLITLQGLRATIITCYALAVIAGLYLVYIGGAPVIAIGVLSILASWAYSATRWSIGRLGLADPLFFLFFGVVSVVGTYYVQAAAVSGTAAWRSGFPMIAFAVSVPVGALTTCILIIDDIRDREFDIVKGKKSVAVRFGARWSRAEFTALMVIAYLAPFWLWLSFDLSARTLLPLLTLPIGLAITRAIYTRDTYKELLPMTPRAAMLCLAYSVLLAIGLAGS